MFTERVNYSNAFLKYVKNNWYILKSVYANKIEVAISKNVKDIIFNNEESPKPIAIYLNYYIYNLSTSKKLEPILDIIIKNLSVGSMGSIMNRECYINRNMTVSVTMNDFNQITNKTDIIYFDICLLNEI